MPSFFRRARRSSNEPRSRTPKRGVTFKLEGFEDRTLLSGGIRERGLLAAATPAIVHPFARAVPSRANISVSVTSGPGNNGKVTLTGKAAARASVQIDLDANGTIEQTVKADRRGKFSTSLFVGYGASQIKVSTTQRGRAPSVAMLTVNRPDSVAPSILMTSVIPNGKSNSQVVISGRATDVGAGLNGVTVSINGGPDQGVAIDGSGNFTYMSSLPQNGSADGVYVFAFTARDRAGNASAPVAGVHTLDTKGPGISITSPAQGLLTAKNPTITGQVSDAGGSGVASLRWRVDSGAYTSVPADTFGQFTFTTALATNGSADGAHTVTILATDQLGNQSTQTFNFTLDTTVAPPSFTSPASGAVVTQNVIVAGKVPVSLTNPQVSIDSGVFVALTVDAAGNFSFPTTFALNGTDDGIHTVTVRGTSPTSTILSNSVSFRLDTTAPSLTISAPTANEVVTGNLNVTGITSDGGSGLSSLTMRVDSGAFVALTVDAAGNFSVPTNFALDGSSDGPHTITLRSTDQAGNVNEKSVEITLAAANAGVTFTSPTFGQTVTQNVTITGKVASGLTDAQFSMDSAVFAPLTVDGSGNFSFLTTFLLDGSQDGTHTFTVKATNQSNQTYFWNLQFVLSTT